MSEFQSLRTAADYAGVSYQSILNWSKEYAIGELRDGRWVINKEKLDRIVAAHEQIQEIRASLKA